MRRRGRDAFWYLPGKLGVKGHYGNIVLAVLKNFGAHKIELDFLKAM